MLRCCLLEGSREGFPIDSKNVISETFFPANLLASILKKLNPTQQKQTFIPNTKYYNTK